MANLTRPELDALRDHSNEPEVVKINRTAVILGQGFIFTPLAQAFINDKSPEVNQANAKEANPAVRMTIGRDFEVAIDDESKDDLLWYALGSAMELMPSTWFRRKTFRYPQ